MKDSGRTKFNSDVYCSHEKESLLKMSPTPKTFKANYLLYYKTVKIKIDL